jgi:GTP-binding protein
VGGLGNRHFATPTRQAPEYAQPGKPGKARKFRLELKLLADVALIGFPNAGKSTLISHWRAAKPKIGSYPFTTLVPNLGVVRAQGVDFVLADIPGIIEGAAEGKGLGHRFLRHAERTRALVLMIDLDPYTGRSLLEEAKTLMKELRDYSSELAQRPMCVALTKADLWFSSDEEPKLKALLEKEELQAREVSEFLEWLQVEGFGEKTFLVSSAADIGLEELKNHIASLLADLGPREYRNHVSTLVSYGNTELFGDSEDDEEGVDE